MQSIQDDEESETVTCAGEKCYCEEKTNAAYDSKPAISETYEAKAPHLILMAANSG